MNYSNGNKRLTGWKVPQTNLTVSVYVHGTANEPIGTNPRYGYLWVSNRTATVPSVDGTNFWVYDLDMNLGTQKVVAAIRDRAGNTSCATNQVVLSVVTNGTYLMNTAGCVTSIVYQGKAYSNRRDLTWDGLYQLTLVKTNGGALAANNFQYDAFGRWSWGYMDAGGVYVVPVYDGDHLAADVKWNAGATLIRSYTYGPGTDNLLSMTIHTGAVAVTYWYLTDIRGTVHGLVDESGRLVEQYRYDAWGRVLGIYNGSGALIAQSAYGNRFLFMGREYFKNSALYNFRARWYDPITGRWLSNDPIGISGGLNQYVFCDDNPVNFTDPMGLDMYALRRKAHALFGTVDHRFVVIDGMSDKNGKPIYYQVDDADSGRIVGGPYNGTVADALKNGKVKDPDLRIEATESTTAWEAEILVMAMKRTIPSFKYSFNSKDNDCRSTYKHVGNELMKIRAHSPFPFY